MKQKLLLLSVLFVAFSMNAQYTVEDSNGDPVLDGHIVTYGTLTYPEASWDFYVNNVSTTDAIRMKIEFVSAINADGSQMELCFGLCYTGIVIGNSYPPNADYVGIAPGGQTLPGNHMFNSDPGNGTDMVIYTFRYYQIDNAGNEIGDDLTVIYRYDPTLGVADNNVDVNLFATSITDELVVNVQEDVNLTIYDLQGRVVKTQALEIGQQYIDLSHLSAQMYLAHFENNRGVSQTTKFVVNK